MRLQETSADPVGVVHGQLRMLVVFLRGEDAEKLERFLDASIVPRPQRPLRPNIGHTLACGGSEDGQLRSEQFPHRLRQARLPPKPIRKPLGIRGNRTGEGRVHWRRARAQKYVLREDSSSWHTVRYAGSRGVEFWLVGGRVAGSGAVPAAVDPHDHRQVRAAREVIRHGGRQARAVLGLRHPRSEVDADDARNLGQLHARGRGPRRVQRG